MKFVPLLISLISFTAMSALASDQPFFQPNDRVLFEGDSLTD